MLNENVAHALNLAKNLFIYKINRNKSPNKNQLTSMGTSRTDICTKSQYPAQGSQLCRANPLSTLNLPRNQLQKASLYLPEPNCNFNVIKAPTTARYNEVQYKMTCLFNTALLSHTLSSGCHQNPPLDWFFCLARRKRPNHRLTSEKGSSKAIRHLRYLTAATKCLNGINRREKERDGHDLIWNGLEVLLFSIAKY